jgi:lysophospholipase L1-like esterase
MQEANQKIEAFSRKDARLVFADVATVMLDHECKPRDELLAADGLHLSEQGYAVWVRVLTPLIERCVEVSAPARAQPRSRPR